MHDIGSTQTEAWETFEYEGPNGGGYPGPVLGQSILSEADEMEYASELLGVSNEAELDQFLGDLFKKAAGAVGGFIRSPMGQQLGGALKNIARRALPAVANALGQRFNLPPEATSAITDAASQIFGLELEGMSPEDQEFETARQFVRLSGEAAKQLAQNPNAPTPAAAVQNAINAAAQQYAPGLVGGRVPISPSTSTGVAQSGRWVRRGRKIVLLGI